MKSFAYLRANTIAEAAAEGAEYRQFLAGGTTLLDLMKCGVEQPDTLIDIGRLPGLDSIGHRPGMLSIGALAKMSHVAASATVKAFCPALSQSLLQAASPQIRNMATIGGNLMQRTRCAYFRDPAFAACNKRTPGSGCAAIGGVTPNHALLGASSACIATYPGDLAVVLVALDAIVRIVGAVERTVAAADFFLLPGNTPHLEHPIARDELILGIDVPLTPASSRSTYLKVRQRHSYEFATVGVAAAIDLEDDGQTVRIAQVALGGVATIPWRVTSVEAALIGKPFDEAAIRAASNSAIEGARTTEYNAYKLDLIPRAVARALLSLKDDA